MTPATAEAFATLGDLLAGARKDSARFSGWLESADPALAVRLKGALDPGESVTARVRTALADFAADASESDWATLISALRDSADPGLEALRRMLLKSLSAEPGG